MKIDKETQDKLQELQITEHNIQNFLMQKQTFQVELNELDSALEEIKKASDDVFKIVGQVMVKTEKNEVEKEMQEKKRIIGLRIKALENQEKILTQKLSSLQKELEDKMSKH